MSERQHHQEGTMYCSGIDQHKRDCAITTYAADGQRVKQQRVPNDPSRLRAYFTSRPGPHRAVVESTGFWYWLADMLDEFGVDLVLAHAPRLKVIAAARPRPDGLSGVDEAGGSRRDVSWRAVAAHEVPTVVPVDQPGCLTGSRRSRRGLYA